jgi:hypothetical protein
MIAQSWLSFVKDFKKAKNAKLLRPAADRRLAIVAREADASGTNRAFYAVPLHEPSSASTQMVSVNARRSESWC